MKKRRKKRSRKRRIERSKMEKISERKKGNELYINEWRMENN